MANTESTSTQTDALTARRHARELRAVPDDELHALMALSPLVHLLRADLRDKITTLSTLAHAELNEREYEAEIQR